MSNNPPKEKSVAFELLVTAVSMTHITRLRIDIMGMLLSRSGFDMKAWKVMDNELTFGFSFLPDLEHNGVRAAALRSLHTKLSEHQNIDTFTIVSRATYKNQPQEEQEGR